MTEPMMLAKATWKIRLLVGTCNRFSHSFPPLFPRKSFIGELLLDLRRPLACRGAGDAAEHGAYISPLPPG